MSALHLPHYYIRHFIKPFKDRSLICSETRFWFFAAFLQWCYSRGTEPLTEGCVCSAPFYEDWTWRDGCTSRKDHIWTYLQIPLKAKVNKNKDFCQTVQFCECCQCQPDIMMFVLKTRIFLKAGMKMWSCR